MKVMRDNSKSEKYKLTVAIVLGVIAVGLVVFLFFGDSFSGSSTTVSNKNSNTTKTAPTPRATTTPEDGNNKLTSIAPIVYTQLMPPPVNGSRNIFDIYVPPLPTPTPFVSVTPPPPKPPPQTLTTIQPANVYARVPNDFTIQVFGDKFTPETRITFDNNDLPTKFINAQQLTAVVPASFIYNHGARQIMVRTPDGILYSNVATLNVMEPPMPEYLYIGLIGDKHYKDDIALLCEKDKKTQLCDKNNKDIFQARLGGMIKPLSENRFKVISISEREIVVIDKTLNIKHTVSYIGDGKGTSNAGGMNSGYPAGLNPNPRFVPPGTIPGIDPSIPRYQPTPKKADDDDDDDPK